MTAYIFDTDHASLVLRQDSQVIARAQQQPYSVTVITVQELFNGWMGRINESKQVGEISPLYSKLWMTTEYLKSVEVLNFTEAAEERLKALLRNYPPLRKRRLQKDLRIAAIALTLDAVVVTRNIRDFSQVPGLKFENWSIETTSE